MNKIKVATHDGNFHADEVFALAVLKIFFNESGKQIEIARTRDPKKISECQIVVDVGNKYDHKNSIYDHHQKDKPGFHKNGVPYASFGLVWKHFGKKISPNKKVYEVIEKKIVSPIDALDNGINISVPVSKEVNEYAISHVISAISAYYGDDGIDEAFNNALGLAEIVLKGEIVKVKSKIHDEKIITQEIKKQKSPEILILDKYHAWESTVSKVKNIKMVIFPDRKPDRWCIQTAGDSHETFGTDRASFPHHWRGLSDIDLASATEIQDSVFCHTGGFFAVAKTKNAAITLATKAMQWHKNLFQN